MEIHCGSLRLVVEKLGDPGKRLCARVGSFGSWQLIVTHCEKVAGS